MKYALPAITIALSLCQVSASAQLPAQSAIVPLTLYDKFQLYLRHVTPRTGPSIYLRMNLVCPSTQ
ncbi:MAG: hypothetical protein JO182_03040 [Acidobacteriaceae bacterium]|nr:hypothetical protein [Acidobacteriaceae bacterium]